MGRVDRVDKQVVVLPQRRHRVAARPGHVERAERAQRGPTGVVDRPQGFSVVEPGVHVAVPGGREAILRPRRLRVVVSEVRGCRTEA